MIIHKEDQTELLSQRLSLKSSSLNPYIPTKRDRLHESSLSIPLGLMQSPLLSYIILRLYLSSITRFLSPPFFFWNGLSNTIILHDCTISSGFLAFYLQCLPLDSFSIFSSYPIFWFFTTHPPKHRHLGNLHPLLVSQTKYLTNVTCLGFNSISLIKLYFY